MAFVYIGELLRELMNEGSLTDARNELIEELQAEEVDQREGLDALRARLEAADPDSDEAQAIYEQVTEEIAKQIIN